MFTLYLNRSQHAIALHRTFKENWLCKVLYVALSELNAARICDTIL